MALPHEVRRRASGAAARRRARRPASRPARPIPRPAHRPAPRSAANSSRLSVASLTAIARELSRPARMHRGRAGRRAPDRCGRARAACPAPRRARRGSPPGAAGGRGRNRPIPAAPRSAPGRRAGWRAVRRAAARRRRSSSGRLRAIRLPARPPAALRKISRLALVAASSRIVSLGADAPRRLDRRALGDLRLLDIGDERRAGGKLRPAEGAERLHRRHAERLAQATLRRARIEEGRRQRRQRRADVADRIANFRILREPVGDQHFARLDARRARRKPALGAFRDAEFARRYVDPGHRMAVGAVAAGDPHDCRQEIVAPGVEQPLLGQSARRDEAGDPRRTTDFPPRLRASAGSSVCSQTATRWPSAISFCR